MSNRKNFVGTEKRVRISHGKRAVGVPAIEILLYEGKKLSLPPRSTHLIKNLLPFGSFVHPGIAQGGKIHFFKNDGGKHRFRTRDLPWRRIYFHARIIRVNMVGRRHFIPISKMFSVPYSGHSISNSCNGKMSETDGSRQAKMRLRIAAIFAVVHHPAHQPRLIKFCSPLIHSTVPNEIAMALISLRMI